MHTATGLVSKVFFVGWYSVIWKEGGRGEAGSGDPTQYMYFNSFKHKQQSYIIYRL